MADPAPPLPPALPTPSTTQLFRAGRQAFAHVPGLRKLLVQGLLLTWGGLLVLGGAGVLLLQKYLIVPLAGWITVKVATLPAPWEGIAATLGSALTFVLQLAMWVSAVAAAVLLSLSLLGIWYESLVEHIVRHCRAQQGEAVQLAPGLWLRNLPASLVSTLGVLLVVIFAFLLGLVPVVGPFLAFGLNGWLLGRELVDPYITMRVGLGDDRASLGNGMLRWELIQGCQLLLLGLVPLAGFLVVPILMIHMVAGFAYLGEADRRHAHKKAHLEPANPPARH